MTGEKYASERMIPRGGASAGLRHTARRGQNQRVLDRLERHAALMQLGREQTVRPAHGAARARSRTVSFEEPPDILVPLHGFSPADRAATDPGWSRCGSNAARG